MRFLQESCGITHLWSHNRGLLEDIFWRSLVILNYWNFEEFFKGWNVHKSFDFQKINTTFSAIFLPHKRYAICFSSKPLFLLHSFLSPDCCSFSHPRKYSLKFIEIEGFCLIPLLYGQHIIIVRVLFDFIWTSVFLINFYRFQHDI